MDLEKRIGYTFKNKTLLKDAITHTSSENLKNSNRIKRLQFERLEFLGDRVLGVIIASWVFEKFSKDTEGDLAKRYTALVCRETCEKIAKKINLVIDARCDNKRTSILSDGMEALIGAIFLDGGFEAVSDFIKKFWPIEDFKKPPIDSKSKLQEIAQSLKKPAPTYKLINKTGEEHNLTFEVAVELDNKILATGTGHTKKSAEHVAAKKAIAVLCNC